MGHSLVRSLGLSHRSLILLLRTVRFACALRFAHSPTRSLMQTNFLTRQCTCQFQRTVHTLFSVHSYPFFRAFIPFFPSRHQASLANDWLTCTIWSNPRRSVRAEMKWTSKAIPIRKTPRKRARRRRRATEAADDFNPSSEEQVGLGLISALSLSDNVWKWFHELGRRGRHTQFC